MFKFAEATTIRFVEEYILRECLWNVRSASYRNKQAKARALAEIVQVMGISEFGLKEVEAKIKSIRSTYSQELKKIKDSMRSGTGTEDIYVSNIKWFPIMHEALKSVNSEIRKTNSNLANNEDVHIEEAAEVDQPSSSAAPEFIIPSTSMSTRKRRLNSLHSLVDKVSKMADFECTEKSEDEFDQFGKSIAAQLKSMPLVLALQAQKDVQNYLTDLRVHNIVTNKNTTAIPISIPILPSPSPVSPNPSAPIQIVNTQRETEEAIILEHSPDILSQALFSIVD